MNLQKTTIPSLNGLRTLSILLVILGHLSIQYTVFGTPEQQGFLRPFVTFLTDAQLGVNVFFVVSGFLICTLLLREEAKFGRIAVGRFFLRRMLRIFPAYFTLLAFYFVLTQLHELTISKESWATSLTFTKYINRTLDWQTAHFWSLSIEEQFYLIWPFIFLTGPQLRKRITLAILLLVPVLRIVAFYTPHGWMDDLSFFQRVDAIAIGCFIAFHREAIAGLLKNYWRILWWSAVILLFLLPYLPNLLNALQVWFLILPVGTTHGSIANACIAVLLLHALEVKSSNWFRFLNLRWIDRIGIFSYGIYLWQQFFLFRSDHWYNQLPVNLLLLAFVVLISYYGVEKPFLKLKNRAGRK